MRDTTRHLTQNFIWFIVTVVILSVIGISIFRILERTDSTGTAIIRSSKVKEEKIYPITLYYDIIVSQNKPKLVFIKTIPAYEIQLNPIYFEEFKSDNGCEMIRIECETISFVLHSHKCTNFKCIYPK